MPPQAKITSCTNCKQMKVKCDAREVFPASCSRCKKHSITCSIDPTFQRTAKRRRADALAREVQQLRAGGTAAMPASVMNSTLSPSSASPTVPQQQPHTLGDPSAFASSTMYPEYGAGISSFNFTAQKIGDIELPPIAAAEILNCYFSTYHADFPVLPEPSIFVQGYYRCPLLFWVLIAVASKSLDQYAEYHTLLEPHVHQLATNYVSSADHPLGTVQALLILCWWPFPFQAARNDPTWMYCGIATHTALRFGLHRPQHFSDFVYNDTLDEAGVLAFEKAWVGCFIVNQIVSSELGVPSTMAPDRTILAEVNRPNPRLPRVLDHHLKIAYQTYCICHSLGSNDAEETGLLLDPFSLMAMFQRRLNALEADTTPTISPIAELSLMRTRLQLCSFAFAHLPSGTSEPLPTDRSMPYVAKASMYAMKLIESAATKISSRPWSFVVRICIVYAAHILLRCCALLDGHDGDMARNSIRQAWTLLSSKSEMAHDSFARACDVIAYLGRKDVSEWKRSYVRPVRSRMACNFMFESIWRARERFSGQIRLARPSDYTATAAAVEEFQYNLFSIMDTDFVEGGTIDLGDPDLNYDAGNGNQRGI